MKGYLLGNTDYELPDRSFYPGYSGELPSITKPQLK